MTVERSGARVPASPTLQQVTAFDGTAILLIEPPSGSGGAIMGYDVSATPRGTSRRLQEVTLSNVACQTGDLSSTDGRCCEITVEGLSSDASFVFSVSAVNVAGTGSPSVPVMSEWPWLPVLAATSVELPHSATGASCCSTPWVRGSDCGRH